MTFAGARVGPGTRFMYDGEIIEVVELGGRSVSPLIDDGHFYDDVLEDV